MSFQVYPLGDMLKEVDRFDNFRLFTKGVYVRKKGLLFRFVQFPYRNMLLK